MAGPIIPTGASRPRSPRTAAYLVITVWKGTDDKYRILYKDLAEPYAMPVELIDNFDNEYTFVGNDGPRLLLQDRPRRAQAAADRDRHSHARSGKPGERSFRRRRTC